MIRDGKFECRKRARSYPPPWNSYSRFFLPVKAEAGSSGFAREFCGENYELALEQRVLLVGQGQIASLVPTFFGIAREKGVWCLFSSTASSKGWHA